MEIFTIGVYQTTEQEFFNKLIANNIDTFCDIRQRRAVRGSKYSFVNKKRLVSRLQELNLNYLYIIDLAPTKDIRELQKITDIKLGNAKRDRFELGKDFILAYTESILNNFDIKSFIDRLRAINSKRIVFFCVEENPHACHRSIVSDKFKDLGYVIKHL